MTTITDLIERLEKAEGPSYALEVEIALATDFWAPDRIKSVTRSEDGRVTAWFTDGPELPLPPNVTASLDAAVALAERVLPGWRLYVEQSRDGTWFGAVKSPKVFTENVTVESGSPAIALVLATLKAMEATR